MKRIRRRSTKRSKSIVWTGILASLLALLAIKKFDHFGKSKKISQEELRDQLVSHIAQDRFPKEILLQRDPAAASSSKSQSFVEYTIDSAVQERSERLLNRYAPDYGAIVVMDATSGEILALAQSSKKEHTLGHLALSAAFPAASVYKIVTAAAAIDQGKAYTETVIPFNGRSHTLYKKQLMGQEENRWTRHVTLREAFGKSINTVFGKLGIFNVGPRDLDMYAGRFFFNRPIPSDLALEISGSEISENADYELAETASGFTQLNTLSPVHGAMIAAAIVNEGSLVAPYVVKRISDAFNRPQYEGKTKILGQVISPYSAEQMKLLMRETVTRGTSRRFFKSLVQNDDFSASLGGKTGSLTGKNPNGKCDWFVGYGYDQDRKIAISILTVHEKYWTVKSSYLARSLLEEIFKDSRDKDHYAISK